MARTPPVVWGVAVVAAFGIFLFGYNVGSINGVQDMAGFRAVLTGVVVDVDGNNADGDSNESVIELDINKGLHQCGVAAEDSDEPSSEVILGLLVSVVNLGGLLGSILAGKLADFASRKVTIMVGGSLTAIGGTLLCTAVNVWMIVVGRFIAGIGFGLLYMVVPVYIAEISPERSRGKLSSTIGPMFAGGLLVAFTVNLGCVELEFGWRISLGLQSAFALVFVFGMMVLPRTPRWLLMKGKDDEAECVLARIRFPSISNSKETKEVFIDLKKSIQGTEEMLKMYTCKSQFRYLFTWRIGQRVFIGVVIASLSPICGNFLLYYSVTLFCKLHILPYITTVLMGVLNLGASLVTIFLVEKMGRKMLLLVGSLCMLCTLLVSVILIIFFRIEEGKNMAAGYVVVVLLCVFVLSFSATWLTVPWIVNSEIFPMCVRGIAVSLTSGALWMAAFIPIQLFPVLLVSPLRTHGTLSIIAALTMFSFVFTFIALPETKGVQLEDVDEVFSGSWSRRIKQPEFCCVPKRLYK